MSKGVSEYLGFIWYVKRCVRILRIFTVCQKVCPNTSDFYGMSKGVQILRIFTVCQKVCPNA